MIDVAIIGAGPYGLSLAAHFREAGLNFRIFGKTMDSWKNRMPVGMLLKSHAWASTLFDPGSRHSLERYCAKHNLPYHDSSAVIPLETFAAYGETFQAEVVPNVEQKLLTQLQPVEHGFRATFDDGEVVMARRVVVAVGIHPFEYMPDTLSNLPSEVLTHSGDHGPFDTLIGKRVAIIGYGASATGLAALLHESGVKVTLVARTDELHFSMPDRTDFAFLRRTLRPLARLINPQSGIGAGWPLKISSDMPWLFNRLPTAWRMHIVRNTLGPLGHREMRERVVGKVPTLLQREPVSSLAVDGVVRLALKGPDGEIETLEVDHVIAATGYRIDLARLGFLDQQVRSHIRTIAGSPILSSNYESSLPGLHFVGIVSADSFGPVARFMYGAKNPSRTITRQIVTAGAKAPKASAKLTQTQESVG